MEENRKYNLFKDFLDDLNYSKKHILRGDDSEEATKQYHPYIVNRAFSMGAEGILHANEMNKFPSTDKTLHYDYFINSMRKAKRYSKWVKPTNLENLETIRTAFQYTNNKAKEVLSILSDEDIETIAWNLRKGGNNETG